MLSFMCPLGVPSYVGNSMLIKLSLEACLVDEIKAHSRFPVKEIILDNRGEFDPAS